LSGISKKIPGFKSRNTENNSTFIEVRAKLAEICYGIQRCAYCEHAPANEVEHIYNTQKRARIIELQEEDHPTVWKEVQRSHQEGRLALLDPDFDALFVKCPEALDW
jgi:hypothetical protein